MLTARTRLVVLLGDPVAHSRSPALHNAAFRALGLDLAYVAAKVRPADLGAAVAGLRALGAVGANVTIPHKATVLAHLDALTDAARAAGAANTLVARDDGALEGDNTDVGGFLDGLGPHARRLAGAEAVVFGTGGAARAVVYALLSALGPARLTLAARTPAHAEALALDLAPYDPRGALAVVPLADAADALRAARLVVNATPLGMHPLVETTPWEDGRVFGPGQVVYDLVYAPRETRLLREATGRGATPIDGLPMLAAQAARAFRRWTGQALPDEVLRAWSGT